MSMMDSNYTLDFCTDILDDCFSNNDTFSQKDQTRLKSAVKDRTLVFPNLCSPSKKVAFVKASKQNYVGMIVGKKGSNIMPMRNQTNTDVQNPQQENEPIFRVYGDSYKDLLEMAIWILEQDDRLSGKDSNNGRYKMEARIWCCSKYVGLLVGPNGGTIREIIETSGCSSIQSPPRDEKIKYFTLTGLWEQISRAFHEMDSLIKKKYDQSGYYRANKTCDCSNVCERLKMLPQEIKIVEHMSPTIPMPSSNVMNQLSPSIPPLPTLYNKTPQAFNSPYSHGTANDMARRPLGELNNLQQARGNNMISPRRPSLENSPLMPLSSINAKTSIQVTPPTPSSKFNDLALNFPCSFNSADNKIGQNLGRLNDTLVKADHYLAPLKPQHGLENSPLMPPNSINIVNHQSPPMTIPHSPQRKIGFNSPYCQNITDQVVRAARFGQQQNSPTTSSVGNTPSIRGSRVFSENNNLNCSPNYTSNYPNSIPAMTELLMNNNRPQEKQVNQLPSPRMINKQLMDLIPGYHNIDFTEDLAQLLLMEFQNLQVNHDGMMKNGPRMNEIASPCNNQSLMNEFINFNRN